MKLLIQDQKKKNFFLEFDKVWVHGLLHLIGYNHIKNKDRNNGTSMRAKGIKLFNISSCVKDIEIQ